MLLAAGLVLVLLILLLVLVLLLILLVLLLVLILILLILIAIHNLVPPVLYSRYCRDGSLPHISGFILRFEDQTYHQSADHGGGNSSGGGA